MKTLNALAAGIIFISISGCDVQEGTHNVPGNVTNVSGDTVTVSIPGSNTPLRLSGPTEEQTALAQQVCDLNGKTANYVSYTTRSRQIGTLHTWVYDLIFVCSDG